MKTRIKDISKIAAVILAIILFIIVGAYYTQSMREKPPARLGITPEITSTTSTSTTMPLLTTVNFEIGTFWCNSDEDCSDREKCEENLYYYKTGNCINYKCSYGVWIRGTCTQSKQYCGADCDGGGCPRTKPDCNMTICKCVVF